MSNYHSLSSCLSLRPRAPCQTPHSRNGCTGPSFCEQSPSKSPLSPFRNMDKSGSHVCPPSSSSSSSKSVASSSIFSGQCILLHPRATHTCIKSTTANQSMHALPFPLHCYLGSLSQIALRPRPSQRSFQQRFGMRIFSVSARHLFQLSYRAYLPIATFLPRQPPNYRPAILICCFPRSHTSPVYLLLLIQRQCSPLLAAYLPSSFSSLFPRCSLRAPVRQSSEMKLLDTQPFLSRPVIT